MERFKKERVSDATTLKLMPCAKNSGVSEKKTASSINKEKTKA